MRFRQSAQTHCKIFNKTIEIKNSGKKISGNGALCCKINQKRGDSNGLISRKIQDISIPYILQMKQESVMIIMNKKRILFSCAIAAFALSACFLWTNLDKAEAGELPEQSNTQTISTIPTTPALTSEQQAVQLIDNAFSYDASEIIPKVDESSLNTTSLWYVTQDSGRFVVEFKKDLPYPAMLYHFCHSEEDPGFDLAKEGPEYFKDDMIDTAKDFVQKVYQVDCTDAEVHAYGYLNKISVQLEVSPEQVFSVRFYYKNPEEPVGVLFLTDKQLFQHVMEKNYNPKVYL